MMFLADDPGTAVVKVLTAWGFWSAIISTIAIIFLGWIFTNRGVLKTEWKTILIKLVMSIGLPCLAFDGFMTNADATSVKSEIALLIAGVLFYVIMLLFSKYLYFKYDKDIQEVLSMQTTFALTTFFGIPVVITLFPGNESNLSSQILNVPFRIFVYSFGFMIIARPIKTTANVNQTLIIDKNVDVQGGAYATVKTHETKKRDAMKALKNVVLNPVLIATIVGFIFWVTQLIPNINVVPDQNHPNGVISYVFDPITNEYKKVVTHYFYSPLRLDNLFPPFFKITKILEAICTPLALLAIGITLSSGNIKKAMQNPLVWYGTAMKLFFAPAVSMAITAAVAAIGSTTGLWQISSIGLSVAVIIIATPTASMLMGQIIKYKRQPELASNVMLVSTLFTIIAMPIWVIITAAVGATSIFVPKLF